MVGSYNFQGAVIFVFTKSIYMHEHRYSHKEKLIYFITLSIDE